MEKQLLNKQLVYNKILTNIKSGFENFINSKQYEIGILENTLNKINPSQILQKGYAKIEQDNNNINSKKDMNYQKQLSIYFYDGIVKATPIKENKDEN